MCTAPTNELGNTPTARATVGATGLPSGSALVRVSNIRHPLRTSFVQGRRAAGAPRARDEAGEETGVGQVKRTGSLRAGGSASTSLFQSLSPRGGPCIPRALWMSSPCSPSSLRSCRLSVEEQVHSFLSSYMPPFQFTKEENAAHSTASGRVSVVFSRFEHWLPWKLHHPSPLPILPCSPCLREPLPLRCSSCCHAPVFAVTCWNWVRSCNPKSVVSRRIPRHRFAISCLRRAQFAFSHFNTLGVAQVLSMYGVAATACCSGFQTVIVFVSQHGSKLVLPTPMWRCLVNC